MSCPRRGAAGAAWSAFRRLCNRPFVSPVAQPLPGCSPAGAGGLRYISEKLSEQSADAARDAHERARADRRALTNTVAIPVQHETDARRKRRTVDVIGEPRSEEHT